MSVSKYIIGIIRFAARPGARASGAGAMLEYAASMREWRACAPGDFARFARTPARPPGCPGFFHAREGGDDGKGRERGRGAPGEIARPPGARNVCQAAGRRRRIQQPRDVDDPLPLHSAGYGPEPIGAELRRRAVESDPDRQEARAAAGLARPGRLLSGEREGRRDPWRRPARAGKRRSAMTLTGPIPGGRGAGPGFRNGQAIAPGRGIIRLLGR